MWVRHHHHGPGGVTAASWRPWPEPARNGHVGVHVPFGPQQHAAPHLGRRRVPSGTMTLRYEMSEWKQRRRLFVRPEISTLSSIDEIRVVPAPDGATVTHDAELRFRGVLRFANPVLGVVRPYRWPRGCGMRRVLAGESRPFS